MKKATEKVGTGVIVVQEITVDDLLLSVGSIANNSIEETPTYPYDPREEAFLFLLTLRDNHMEIPEWVCDEYLKSLPYTSEEMTSG